MRVLGMVMHAPGSVCSPFPEMIYTVDSNRRERKDPFWKWEAQFKGAVPGEKVIGRQHETFSCFSS